MFFWRNTSAATAQPREGIVAGVGPEHASQLTHFAAAHDRLARQELPLAILDDAGGGDVELEFAFAIIFLPEQLIPGVADLQPRIALDREHRKDARQLVNVEWLGRDVHAHVRFLDGHQPRGAVRRG